MDPLNVAIVAVLGIAVGVFASHATLGNKITRALTLLEAVPSIERRVTRVERLHFYRRADDDGTATDRGD